MATVRNSGESAPAVLLWGARSQARISEEMIKEGRLGTVEIIFDSTISAPTFESTSRFISDVPSLKCYLHTVSHYIVCIAGAHGYARYKTAQCLENIGLRPLSLVHHQSFIEPTAEVGPGAQIMPYAIVHKFAKIGEQCLLNTNSTIDHECIVGKGVHIMGNVAVAGMVQIGDYATIGTNATILPFLKIGEGAYVGAGAIVTKDVPPYTVVAGVPARHMRKHDLALVDEPLRELLA